MSAQPAQTRSRRVSVSASLALEQDDILRALADHRFRGNKSAALAYLVDVYAGKDVERAELEKVEAAAAPIEIIKWKSSRLTLELVAYVAGLIRAGNMPEVACNLAGITPRQRVAWLKKGRNDRREGKESIHATFDAAIAKSEAECEAQDIRRMREHGQQTWTALAWRLERQYPDRYAQRKRIDGKVQHSLTPMVDYDRFTASELKTFVYLLRKGSPDRNDPHIARDRPPAIETVPDEIIEIVDGDWSEAPALEAPALESGPPIPEAPGLEDEKPER